MVGVFWQRVEELESLEEVGVFLAGFGAGDRVAESLERLERRISGEQEERRAGQLQR